MKQLQLRPPVAWLASMAALVVATGVMLSVRASLDKAHIALLLLLVVLGGSAMGGRVLGLTLAAVSFVVFDWFFLPPYYTFIIANPLDWLVLLAFLVTGIAAAQLLYRAQEEARVARQRADEIDRLATLGVEAISVGSAQESLQAVLNVVRSSLQVATCEVFMAGTGHSVVRSGQPQAGDIGQTPSLVEWVASSGNAATEHSDGTVHLSASRPIATEHSTTRGPTQAFLLPLKARHATVGVLRVADPGGLDLDDARLRFLDAMSYYVALAVDRIRLVGEAEHAAALRERDRLKDALLAAVSHDLRTPLTTIRALAEELRPLGDERSEIIEQEADRLNRMVADLLDLARLNAGELPVRAEINSVDDLLGAMLQRVEPTLKASRLNVVLPAGDMLLLGRFDLVHSLRILVNLVDNAGKYAPSSSPIEVRARREGRELVIGVSDRGSGIPAAELERIFTPFYRAPGSTPDSSRQGAGLGLSIARRLAEIQGGTLTAASREGGGSTFTLRLPAVDAPTEAETA